MASLQVVDLISDDEDKRFEPAARMAQAIIDITQKNGGCLPQDLRDYDFTPDELAAHWMLAKSIAAIELRLMGAASSSQRNGGE